MKLERFKEKKKVYIALLIITLLIGITGGYFLSKTFAKYTYETEEIPFINGQVKYSGSVSGDVMLAFYIDDEPTDHMPKKDTGYMYDEKKSNCDKNASMKWDSIQWAPIILNLDETKTKCELHFNKRNSLGDEVILADQPDSTNVGEAKTKIKAKTKPSFSSTSTTDEGLFMAEDGLGESYYFRGAVDDNWVKFAEFYWRIIRVNGDGTVRMIYNGTGPSETGTDTQIQTKSAFNSTINNPKYVGYMWGDYDSLNKVYANSSPSTIKGVLDQWYETNLKTDFGKYIANEIFCNDRKVTSGNGVSGNNNYSAHTRLVSGKDPTLQCENKNDRFAVKTTEGNIITRVGNLEINESLTYPIGLITADELAMAGVAYGQNNQKYYLYTGQDYWAMSPSYTAYSNAYEFFLNSTGYLANDYSANYSYGVRPVINLRSDISVKGGNGSTEQPYELQLN